MANCVFCKIVKGKVPCHKIYEDDSFLAFLDIHPHSKGHTVIIPKKHIVSFFDLGKLEKNGLFSAVHKTMEILKTVLSPDGFNVGWNDGKTAGQVIPHLHLHIFPRYDGDGGGSMHSIIKNPGEMSVEKVAGLFK